MLAMSKVQCSMFKVQCSKQMFNVQCLKFKAQSSKFKVQSSNLFYISGQEKVRNRVENQLFCYLCKYFVLK